jgi:hypothetical protein
MPTITLRSESGKWSHTTYTEDPLFSSILEPMKEAAGTLPHEITFTGSVADIIERNWHLVQTLMDKLMGNFDGLKFVMKHDLEQISYILNLPPNWEVYTVVDDKDSLPYRLAHMRILQDHLQKDDRLCKIVYECLDSNAQDIVCDCYEISGNSCDQYLHLRSYFGPYVLNLFNRLGNRWHISALTLINSINWYDVRASLPPVLCEGIPNMLILLVHALTGDAIQGIIPRFMLSYAGAEINVLDSAYKSIYKKLIQSSDISTLGLTDVLWTRNHTFSGNIHKIYGLYLDNIVKDTHFKIIRDCLETTKEGQNICNGNNIEAFIPFYPEIVRSIAKELGCDVLIVMRESILEYTNNVDLKAIHAAPKRARIELNIKRCNMFVQCINDYLNK